MKLKNNMSIAELNGICKLKPTYEESYKKGVIGENAQFLNILNREGSFVEVQKHASLNDDINAITVKIFFKPE